MAIAAGCCREPASALCLRRAEGSHPPHPPQHPCAHTLREPEHSLGLSTKQPRGINIIQGDHGLEEDMSHKSNGTFRCWSATRGVLLSHLADGSASVVWISR